MRNVNNGEKVIDSRDIIARIAELQDERDALVDMLKEANNLLELPSGDEDEVEKLGVAVDETKTDLEAWDDDNGNELKALKSLEEQASGYSEDWRHGATLIRDSYFEEYAQEFAEEIDAINRNASWPNDCIDWEKAADELKMDYTEVDFDGVAYQVR